MAPRIARKPAGFSGTRNHGIAVIGNRPLFHKRSRDQCFPLPREGRDGSEDREKACGIVESPQSWHRRDWRSCILSAGIDTSAPPSLPSEGRDGSEDREKACRILGYPLSWHCHDWKLATLSQGIQRSAPPSLPREERDGSEDRERACPIFGPPQSWHRCDWKYGTLSRGIDKSAPPSLASERRDGSEHREKACWNFGARNHGVAVIGNPASFHKGSRDHRLPPCHARGGMAPMIARKPVGLSGQRSHGIDVTGNPAPFHMGSTHQRLSPRQARSGMAPRIARKPAGFWVPAVMALPCLEIGHHFTRDPEIHASLPATRGAGWLRRSRGSLWEFRDAAVMASL